MCQISDCLLDMTAWIGFRLSDLWLPDWSLSYWIRACWIWKHLIFVICPCIVKKLSLVFCDVFWFSASLCDCASMNKNSCTLSFHIKNISCFLWLFWYLIFFCKLSFHRKIIVSCYIVIWGRMELLQIHGTSSFCLLWFVVTHFFFCMEHLFC